MVNVSRGNWPMDQGQRKLVKFLERHLGLLPVTQEGNDVNKLAIVFYSLESLSALDELVCKKYHPYKSWLLKHYTTWVDADGRELGGFVGSLNLVIPGVNSLSLANTLFALVCLLTLCESYEEFENTVAPLRKPIIKFIKCCQLKSNGAFVSVLNYQSSEPSPVDHHDLRFCYIAVSILYLLGDRSISDFQRHINVGKLMEYIMAQRCDVGGFGEFGEPHAGYTSCALSALKLLGQLDQLPNTYKEETIFWLLSRQTSGEGCEFLQEGKNENYDALDHGGFQGRENKFADTCYVFWCLNSLQCLTPEWTQFTRTDLARSFLQSRTQNSVVGGFSKNDEDDPDLYHTCLAIAGLRLTEGKFNGELCIPLALSDKFRL
ncbi:protein geranylgeranyltransferase type I subunit CDC43 KNAG_0I00610 [Huiozyma naganishii CBS 8797]|uniref:Prenyltransferase alpha-alpha toroid domain-containing protein n=1 Tax=Huiozyma naganishii (strain ATCC MYA-139 / BCRC 22969 / CBS 8797 / KCTC 17520 / NBRC 10181 / NCYC 3082 / Yp74L-3) TaxID=1071383 RepID=J7S258_HUIN7|nr:hypothetical protein KNAG_0I00610 [Kazachstania naganishii CBS 8797]CCK71852.1 hypothetical protein KNAG_0I00610 [Kazachstania naganishii CBS 8797]